MSKILTHRGRELLIELARADRKRAYSGPPDAAELQRATELTEAIEALNNLQVTE
jgi:hypothetical protein